ncbi:MAG: hypothetical protein ABI813_06975 [Bacteroidota bacterium]
MKHAIVSNWNILRALRLIIGMAIIIQAIFSKDILFGMAGLLISGMAVLNIGCCGIGTCYTPVKQVSKPAEDIS